VTGRASDEDGWFGHDGGLGGKANAVGS
jgi:hypothetical protein